MRISVNLASRPFVEIRPLLARLRLVMGLLAALALGLGLWLHSVSQRAAAAQARIDAVHAQTLALQQQKTANEARMRQPQNRDVLDRSHFLNGVFARKSFSWTAVMMDLERVLPPGVQVTSIEPLVSKEGEVTIRLRVSGDRDRAIQLVRNPEHSSRFLQPRLSSESTQATEGANGLAGGARTAPAAPGSFTFTSTSPDGGRAVAAPVPGGVEFDILSGYNPLPEPNRRPVVTSVPPSPSEQGPLPSTKGHAPVAVQKGYGAPPSTSSHSSGEQRLTAPSAGGRR